MKKYIKVFMISLIVLTFMVACSAKNEKADYTTVEAEQALNNGESLDGKTVKIKVDKLVPDSAFGYNIQTGKHLNFVSTKNPNVKEGDSLIVKITKVESTMGSYIITYKK